MTSDNEGFARADLWEYACKLYSRKGAEPLLLSLQDEHGADVLLLIASSWSYQNRVALDAGQWQSIASALAPWREQVIDPLRKIRRYLLQESGRSALYDQMKAAELNAEKEQLARLSDQIAQHGHGSAAQGLLPALEACCAGQGIKSDGLLKERLESLAQMIRSRSAPACRC